MEKDVLLDQPKYVQDKIMTELIFWGELQKKVKKGQDMHRNSADRGRKKERIVLL